MNDNSVHAVCLKNAICAVALCSESGVSIIEKGTKNSMFKALRVVPAPGLPGLCSRGI